MEKEVVIVFYALFAVATVCDAIRDAWTFDNLFGDGQTDFIDEARWHPVKNIGRLAGWIAFYVLATGDNHVLAIFVFLTVIPGAWAIWQMVYNYARDSMFFMGYDFNLSKFIMIKGAEGRPYTWRIDREAMIIISVLMVMVSIAGASVMLDIAR